MFYNNVLIQMFAPKSRPKTALHCIGYTVHVECDTFSNLIEYKSKGVYVY